MSSGPIRPFITGLAVAAGWGALNVPERSSFGLLGEFAATMVVITLVAGGILAMVIEAIKLVARHIRERFRK
ncbi:MAG TPA: hypothetical protein VMA37_10275 [Acetobacteraceae bacterium]|nr:hypothetical protein [Acetobacteraceae bacterium]